MACANGCAVIANPATTTVPHVRTVEYEGSKLVEIYFSINLVSRLLTFPSGDPILEAYLVFSAYQIQAVTNTDAVGCNTALGQPTTLSSQYSVISPPAIDSSALQYNATTSLIRFLGLHGCTPLVAAPAYTHQPTPTETGLSTQLISSSSFLLSSLSTTQSTRVSSPTTGPRKGLSPQQETGIAVACSTFLTALIILGTLAWRRSISRKRSIAAAALEAHPSDPSEKNQPYFQQKSELEDEGPRKHELHAEEQRYELAGNSVHEMQDRDLGQEILTETGPETSLPRNNA